MAQLGRHTGMLVFTVARSEQFCLAARGGGSSSSPASISLTDWLTASAIVDVNGDGFLDVVGSPFNGTPNPIPVVAYLGDGTGVFSENNTAFLRSSQVKCGNVIN